MSGKIFNTLRTSKEKLAAWGAAGAVFGAWTWFDQRDDGKILTAEELKSRNQKISGKINGGDSSISISNPNSRSPPAPENH